MARARRCSRRRAAVPPQAAAAEAGRRRPRRYRERLIANDAREGPVLVPSRASVCERHVVCGRDRTVQMERDAEAASRGEERARRATRR